MKLLYKNLFVFFLLPVLATAQSNYKPGNAVALNGDTLRGFIDYREWNSNPAFINFKAVSNDNKSKKLTPRDIDFFSVSGLEEYQKYTGDISMDVIDPAHISNGRDTSFINAAVFLKILQQGDRVVLYAYTDAVKTRLFIKESVDKAPKELIYRIYFDTGGNQSNRTVTESTYLNQLFTIAQKYNLITASFQEDLEHSGYNVTDILKLVNKINTLSKPGYDHKLDNERPVEFFLGGALNIVDTKAGGYYKLAGGTDYTSFLPELSLGINLFANPNTQKLVLRAELIFGASRYRSDYTDKYSPYVPVSYSYNRFSAAVTPQIVYNFYNATNFKIYAGFGLAFTFYKYTGQNFNSQDGKTPTYLITLNPPFAFNTFNTPLYFKAGALVSKNWGIYAAYLTSAYASPGSYFGLSYSSLQIGLNYYFRK